MTHTVKNSSGVIHLRDTEYILTFIQQIFIGYPPCAYSVLGTIPDFRDIEKKKYTAV